MRNSTVKLIDVALQGCTRFALYFFADAQDLHGNTVIATRCDIANSSYGARVHGSLASAKFNNCVFNDNEYDGIQGFESTIHLHGEATAIHSNDGYGISAWNSGKVLIHLPSHHNTSYNNEGQDRNTNRGGTITNVED